MQSCIAMKWDCVCQYTWEVKPLASRDLVRLINHVQCRINDQDACLDVVCLLLWMPAKSYTLSVPLPAFSCDQYVVNTALQWLR
ncbi:predicted protein [Plenodomus lingam JN3]|uniref:Predicted protein n=1 Tax=Leptosphaeria maculans (strain JN3 / isolate v23.1.3 / race Av1-4-5-6-7-8) TaxID=985895 RepID=E4ZRK3_LEPMJ|nr:predicted protein [Plenodomus lingam JN3]CBX93850.1 predicted protein [Plenodomus lingam JN3]